MVNGVIVEPGRMGEVPVVDMWLAVVSAVVGKGVQGSTQSEDHKVMHLVALSEKALELEKLEVVELEMLDVVVLERPDVVDKEMPVLCVDVANVLPVVLVQWVVEVVLRGSKARDTASGVQLRTVEKLVAAVWQSLRNGGGAARQRRQQLV